MIDRTMHKAISPRHVKENIWFAKILVWIIYCKQICNLYG